ncbi:MAG: hypothetical protein NXI20_02090 [bacterium]|nr:hypothetical protein [bacterium]
MSRYIGSYFSSKSISRLATGDSLRLEVSLNSPGKYKVVGYFKGGVFIEVD